MINAVLYSDQIIPENAKVDRRLVDMMKHRGNRICYIPSGPEPNRQFFNERKTYYGQYDIDLSIFYHLDEVHSRSEVDDLLACDAIHLSGGDTVAYLDRIKRSGMLAVLRDSAENGGILIGASAGAILMTPTIAVDALFSGQHPEDISDGAALDLLPFEFFPHLNADPNFLPALLRYSTHTPRPIIGCSDGDGVVVINGNVECIGKPIWISSGEVIPATSSGT